MLTRVPQRLLVVGTAAIATVGALVVDLRNYQQFLFLLGSFFVPLFGVLLADWLLDGRHYARADIFAAPAVRVGDDRRLARRLRLYQWLVPAGARLVDGASSRTRTPTRCRGAVRRCRASRSRSGSPRSRACVTAQGAGSSRARDRADRKPRRATCSRTAFRAPGGGALPRRPGAAPARERRARRLRGAPPPTARSSCRRSSQLGTPVHVPSGHDRPRRFAFTYDGELARDAGRRRSATRGRPATCPTLPAGTLGPRRTAPARATSRRDAGRASPRRCASRSTARASCARPELGPLAPRRRLRPRVAAARLGAEARRRGGRDRRRPDGARGAGGPRHARRAGVDRLLQRREGVRAGAPARRQSDRRRRCVRHVVRRRAAGRARARSARRGAPPPSSPRCWRR